MEIKEKNTYHYNGFSERCSGSVLVIIAPVRGNRVEVSRNLETGINPFWVNKCDLDEILTEEDRLVRKYQNKLDTTNTSSMTKDLKRYSDEDIRKIYTGMIKDLRKMFNIPENEDETIDTIQRIVTRNRMKIRQLVEENNKLLDKS
ncbi:MAG: hypothetical protein GF317_20505 [Candidatus Lokiarchaeota archaeon]|nr:hypothetical protein [Candidatus Lokiarchaeota archaeon]